MCGIIGISVSVKNMVFETGSVIYRGLLRLEYRGYDSAGVAAINNGKLVVVKGKGKIAELEKRLCLSCVEGEVVIGHTRWATHGAPSDINAHPHTDCRGTIAVVHNGIIQNYRELKKILLENGHVFRSETDTEVFPHLVSEIYGRKGDFYAAFKEAVKMITGSYALAVITIHEPDKIFFAKRDSPLIIGLGEGYNMVASDIPALLEFTRNVIVVRDGWVGYVSGNEVYIEDLFTGEKINPLEHVRIVEWSLEDAIKGGYPHYMIKEIREQPKALKETYYGIEKDPAVEDAVKLISEAEKIFFTGAGTSYHACLYGSLLMTKLASRFSYSFIASEYYSYINSINDKDLLIVLSQSGETMDSLKALRAFRERGAKIIAISNVVDSSIPRESDIALYTRAGPEIGVAATKTFTSQTLVLAWLTVSLGEWSGVLTRSEADELRKYLSLSGDYVLNVISRNEALVNELADWLKNKSSVYYLSRGIGLPVAMEGALKLKEIAYIHAEAYPAGESKHGPIALVDDGFPVVFTIPPDSELEKLMLGNIQEMKARGAVVIGVAPDNTVLSDQFDYLFKIPSTHWIMISITAAPIYQLLAYYTATAKNLDPDKPRNLAKTVTVE
ncbi:MAG: glutamine--fructose-6-phosphate transaminase (isomerizing) [Desulfurococcaceae archaeon]